MAVIMGGVYPYIETESFHLDEAHLCQVAYQTFLQMNCMPGGEMFLHIGRVPPFDKVKVSVASSSNIMSSHKI